MKSNKGFTLIELFLVFVVVVIVVSAALPGLLRATQASHEATAIGTLRAINSAQSTFAATCGVDYYAPNLAALNRPSFNGTTFLTRDLVVDEDVIHQRGYLIMMGSSNGGDSQAPEACNGLPAGVATKGYYVTATPEPRSWNERSFGTNTSGEVFVIPGRVFPGMTDTTAPVGAVLTKEEHRAPYYRK